MKNSTRLYFLLSFLIIQSSAVFQGGKETKSLFDIGCATLCQDHMGDPIDVSGTEFAELIAEYIDGGGGNSTNSTNSTDSDVYLIYGDIECWDVSAVTDMSGAFAFQDTFTDSVSCWDVGSVTDMSQMFLNAASFNEDLNKWSERVPRGNINTTDMFVGSGCDVTSPDPDTIGRPWCQYRQQIFSPEFKCFFFGEC